MKRDPLGTRPLYWVEQGGAVYAAASLARLVEASGIRPELDREAVAAALLAPGVEGRALLAGVRVLPRGHELRVDVGRASTRPGPGLPRAAEITPEALRAALRIAVQRHGDAAVALGEGLDSVALLALASESAPRRAFALVDAASDPSDIETARQAARRTGAELALVQISETRLPEAFEEAVLAIEAPIHNARAIAKVVFYDQVGAAGVRRILAGAGADEVFVGNPSQTATLGTQLVAERALAREVLREHARPPEPSLPRGTTLEDDLRDGRALLIDRVLGGWTLPPEVRPGATARGGVEALLPYLDDAVAAIGLAAPIDRLVHGDRGKVLLREAVEASVPDALRHRPRRPVTSVPLGGPRVRSRWVERYSAWLATPRIEALEVVDPIAVRRRFEEIARPDPDPVRAARLERLLMRLASLVILRERIAPTVDALASAV